MLQRGGIFEMSETSRLFIVFIRAGVLRFNFLRAGKLLYFGVSRFSGE